MKKLSICIPTFNRSKKLEALLETIEREIKEDNLYDEVEICISDNASVDGTKEIVRRYSENLLLKYNRNNKNMGFDYNLKKAIEISTSEYSWLCGDDEKLLRGSIKDILQELKEKKADLYILDGEVENSSKNRKLNGLSVNNYREFNTKNKEEFSEYVNSIKRDLSFFCTFISAIVVKRELFLRENIPIKISNSSYDHLYVLLSLLKKGIKVVYLKNSYYCVGHTENTWNNETGKHFFLDIVSLYKFFKMLNLSKEKQLRKAVGNLLMRNRGVIGVIYTYNFSLKNNKEREFESSLKYFYIFSLKNKILKIISANTVSIKILNILKKVIRMVIK